MVRAGNLTLSGTGPLWAVPLHNVVNSPMAHLSFELPAPVLFSSDFSPMRLFITVCP